MNKNGRTDIEELLIREMMEDDNMSMLIGYNDVPDVDIPEPEEHVDLFGSTDEDDIEDYEDDNDSEF